MVSENEHVLHCTIPPDTGYGSVNRLGFEHLGQVIFKAIVSPQYRIFTAISLDMVTVFYCICNDAFHVYAVLLFFLESNPNCGL